MKRTFIISVGLITGFITGLLLGNLIVKADTPFIGRWINVGGSQNSVSSGETVWVEAYCDDKTGNLLYIVQDYRETIDITVVPNGCEKT